MAWFQVLSFCPFLAMALNHVGSDLWSPGLMPHSLSMLVSSVLLIPKVSSGTAVEALCGLGRAVSYGGGGRW
eukprot:12824259-Ditylum_brightwellii.AAC.1